MGSIIPLASTRRARRGDAGHRKTGGNDVRGPREAAVPARTPVASAFRRRASESLDDAPHRPRLPCLTRRKADTGLYGSLSLILGISLMT